MRQVLRPVVFGAALLLAVIPNALMGQSQTNLTRVLVNGQPVEIPDSFTGQPPSNGIVSSSQALGSPESVAFLNAEHAGNVSEMMKQAQALVKAYPSDAWAHVCEGDAYSKAGLKKDALASYQDALKLDPKSYEAEAGMGFLYFLADDATNALEHFEQAVKINPKSSSTWGMIGLSQYQMGSFRDAAAALTQEIKLGGTNSDSRLFLGGARAQLGDADGAKAAYLTYYKLNPKKADEYWDYCLKGHREQSRKALEKVILSRRERLDKGVSVARAYLDTHAGDTGGSGVDRELEQRGRGIVARKTGDDFALKGNYAKAISAYREAVNGGETLTEDSWQYFAIGVCRHEQGGYKEAIDAYRQALAAYPKRLEAWVGLDYALEDTEQFAAAREAIEKLAEYAAGTEFSRVSATLKTELPAIEAASEVRRQTLQESTGPAVQNSGADKKP